MINVITGDCLASLREMQPESVHTCITSPPYFGLRDYGHAGQIGLEDTPEAYVARLVEVFREVRRVLRDDGTLWLNLGDSYASSGGKSQPQPDASGGLGNKKLGTRGNQGSSASYGGFLRPDTARDGIKVKDLLGIPWRVAFALQADGWYLRQEIIWHKPNPMPESVRDRFTKAHEQLFLLSKSPRYYFDQEAVKEPFADSRMGASGAKSLRYSDGAGRKDTLSDGTRKGLGISPGGVGRNRRSVWTVSSKPYAGAHFATFPPDLIEPCVLAGCPVGGTVLDPFGGSGTTAGVAVKHGRRAVLCELNPAYAALVPDRVAKIAGSLFTREAAE
jgi:site-specific DNA-methyltransferase (adenine-specific)